MFASSSDLFVFSRERNYIATIYRFRCAMSFSISLCFSHLGHANGMAHANQLGWAQSNRS
jgi:hypothetical protein